MFFSHRRRSIIYLCLAGMEMTWFTPFVLFFFPQARTWSPFALLGGLLTELLALMLALELLNRLEVVSPQYELITLGLIGLSSLTLVRLWLYPGLPFGDFRWLRNTFEALVHFPQGLRPELMPILINLFLWQRAASATGRDLGFFSVGVSFRLGILLLIVGVGLLNLFTEQNATPFLWLYFGLGLTAVTLARTQEKAADAQSPGPLLPLQRTVQLILPIALVVGGAAGLSLLYTLTTVRTALGWLRPLGVVMGPLLRGTSQLMFWVLEPLLTWLRRLFANLDWEAATEFLNSLRQNPALGTTAEQSQSPIVALPPWAWTLFRYLLVLLAVALGLSLVLLFLDRIRPRPVLEEAEEATGEPLTLGGTTLGRGIRWLRDVVGLARRFGMGRQLLAAISVQNIYANLCRLARQRGYPRRPAQPPDDYLAVLVQAFGGHQEALSRITAAYMRVHYGDQPVSGTELAQLREDYQRIRSDV